ncbi:membrane protein insertion efficiency factor YidD [uncultured Thalassospira sp.]|uniref:membrane protein insertion efficiency factor YidD n=1 Tax=Thalassospira sp. MCCC 1A02491 TaxID=1769751 RepID=UPI0018D394C9
MKILNPLSYLALGAIRMYQLIAPKSVRMKCRFEPSCSNYAATAFRKFPFSIALKKTIDRLGRCKYPNGGIDYP